jgi:hypothetical protein
MVPLMLLVKPLWLIYKKNSRQLKLFSNRDTHLNLHEEEEEESGFSKPDFEHHDEYHDVRFLVLSKK